MLRGAIVKSRFNFLSIFLQSKRDTRSAIHDDSILFKMWQPQTLATALIRQIDSFLKNNCYNVVKVNR